MPKLIQTTVIEYDFALIYSTKPTPKVGDALTSPVIDDTRAVFNFDGTAYVVATEKTFSGPDSETTVYVKTFPPVIEG